LANLSRDPVLSESVRCSRGRGHIHKGERSGGQWGNSMCAVRRQDFALAEAATHQHCALLYDSLQPHSPDHGEDAHITTTKPLRGTRMSHSHSKKNRDNQPLQTSDTDSPPASTRACFDGVALLPFRTQIPLHSTPPRALERCHRQWLRLLYDIAACPRD